MAILHYQFEAIHPFPDGNGRTGRILNILSLMQDGLLDLPTLYLSRYILSTRGEYYRLLGQVTFAAGMGALDSLCPRWRRGDLACGRTQKIAAIRSLMDETTRVRARRGAEDAARRDRADLRAALLPHRQIWSTEALRSPPHGLGLSQGTCAAWRPRGGEGRPRQGLPSPQIPGCAVRRYACLRAVSEDCRPRPLRDAKTRRKPKHERRNHRQPRLRPRPHRRRRARGQARPRLGAPHRRHQDVRRRATSLPVLDAGHRHVRREPRAGGQGQMAGAARALSRHRAASDRPAAVQQDQGGRRSCSTRSTPSTGPRSPRPSPPRWRGRASGCSCSCRSTPARSRRRPASCRARRPRSLRLCREELKLDIAGLMCIPPVDEEPAIHFAFLAKLANDVGLSAAQHGHERRFRDGHCLRRHPRPRRLRAYLGSADLPSSVPESRQAAARTAFLSS